ncbi:TetR family transcriptional regulator [Frigidibacter albus]|uniref:TetR-like C-terminal domain-containing protein n=1 Tax=Frigidibacter albus TaxID=1465486 RepID=UPI00199C8339|nr:TetR-like C-terminal domain-containing protein [Frigidibacter albus]GGH49532.1 TetR family transcriptional regulator [Frigidibacter albus]
MERNRSAQKTLRKPSGAAVPRADLTEALYRAFFEEWAAHGFAALSLERVAARAGAGKAAIYRRFASRHEFAAAAVSALGLRIALPEDRGSLEADVLAFLRQVRAVLRHPLIRRILPDLHAEAARSPQMRALNTQVAEARRAQGQALLDRAIARHELPATLDRALAMDLLPATLYWRMVVIGATPTRAQLAAQATAITAGLRRL